MKFELYKDSSNEYRWRLKASNGRIIADCAEGYSSKQNAKNGILDVILTTGSTPIDDLT